MRKINLKSYPKFWEDFAERVNNEIDPRAAITSVSVKFWLKDWYGITVHITSNGAFAEVYIQDADYTAFLLRWA